MWFLSDGSILPRKGAILLARSVTNDDAHGTAGTCYHAHRGFDIGAVEVGHFLLGDLADVFLADGSDLVSLGTPEAVSMPQAFLMRSAAGGVLR